MQTRRKARKKVINIIKNQEQTAQDKLLQISCWSEDKFVDQSQMLAINHKHEDQLVETVKLNKDIKNIIDKCRKTSYKLTTENSVNSYSRKDRLRLKKTSGVLIANKLQSNQVFVGMKPKTSIQAKLQQSTFLILDRERLKTVSIFNNSTSKSVPVRKLSTELSDKIDLCIFGEKKNDLRNTFYLGGGKSIKRSEKFQSLRGRIRTELFFNQNDKYKSITQKVSRFQ